MKRTTKFAAALLTSGLALGTYTAGTAYADVGTLDQREFSRVGNVNDTASASLQTYKNEAFGGCVDDYGGRLWLRACDDSNEQHWQVLREGNGIIRLHNTGSADCLSDYGNDSGGLGTRGPCSEHGTVQEEFTVKHWNDGTIRFKSVYTDECIDADSDGDLGTRTCDKSESRSWY